jgi:hypothetical protein
MTDRLDAGHVWTPNFGRPGAHDPKYCCEAVAEGGRSALFYQCRNKVRQTRDVLWHGKPVTLGYCNVHDPVKVKAKREARDAKYKADYEAMTAKWAEQARLAKLYPAAVEALRLIAAGHNDARQLARETLAQHGDTI